MWFLEDGQRIFSIALIREIECDWSLQFVIVEDIRRSYDCVTSCCYSTEQLDLLSSPHFCNRDEVCAEFLRVNKV